MEEAYPLVIADSILSAAKGSFGALPPDY